MSLKTSLLLIVTYKTDEINIIFTLQLHNINLQGQLFVLHSFIIPLFQIYLYVHSKHKCQKVFVHYRQTIKNKTYTANDSTSHNLSWIYHIHNIRHRLRCIRGTWHGTKIPRHIFSQICDNNNPVSIYPKQICRCLRCMELVLDCRGDNCIVQLYYDQEDV